MLETPLKFAEIRGYLNCSLDYIYKSLESGKMQGRKIAGKWIVYPSDLEKFVKQQPTNQRRIK